MFWPEPTYPVARSEHRCDMCNRMIAPGEKYKRSAGIDPGSTAWTWRECGHCAALLHLYPDITVWDDEGYCRDSVTEWEPHTFLGLLRQARFRHQWRHGNGDLAAIPTKEAA